MKITKYPQSCLKIEHDGRALLVDIGTLATAEFEIKDFGNFDAVLFTHSHADHFDAQIIAELKDTGSMLYGNSDVAASADSGDIEIVEDGEELVIAGFKVRAQMMEHCRMVDGSDGVMNTGFLINEKLLLPGDSVEDIGIKAPIVALPVFGPDISLHDAFSFAATLEAKEAILVHYDISGLNPDIFERLGGKWSDRAKIQVLQNSESIEIEI